MGQGLLRARSASVTPLFAWDCARIYPARKSNVPKHRHPHQRATTSYLHAYGGAKVNIESALQTLRLQGWIPMASALVGTETRPPVGNKWSTSHCRHIHRSNPTTIAQLTEGRSARDQPKQPPAKKNIDLTLRPHPLTQKEDLLLLSLWRKHCQVPKGCALGTWLRGANKELGPDNDESRDWKHGLGCASISPFSRGYSEQLPNQCLARGSMDYLGKQCFSYSQRWGGMADCLCTSCRCSHYHGSSN